MASIPKKGYGYLFMPQTPSLTATVFRAEAGCGGGNNGARDRGRGGQGAGGFARYAPLKEDACFDPPPYILNIYMYMYM